MQAPLQFISAHTIAHSSEPAPLSVNRPRTIPVSEIVRIFNGPRFVTVETTAHQQPFNGAFHDVARAVRKLFPSVELQTLEDGWQLVNLNAVSAVLVSDSGEHACGLTSGTVLRIGSPTVLLDLLAGVSPVERIAWGRSFWQVPHRHIMGLDNSAVFVRGGHVVNTTEPSSEIERRLSTN